MKKKVSLALLFAALAYATPAAAATFSVDGDIGARVRSETYDDAHQGANDLYWQYRVRLNGSADLGNGYFAKVQLLNEAPNQTPAGTVALGGDGGWQRVGYGNSELNSIGFSQAFFGRNYGDSHYAAGRLPLNSINNPLFDLTLYPKNPLDIPTATYQNDRLFGAAYGTKFAGGDLNFVLGVFDNISGNNNKGTGDGLLNDGYAFIASYKTEVAGVTVEPEILTAVTKFDSVTQETFTPGSSGYGQPWHQGVRPVTFGVNLGGAISDLKLGGTALVDISKGTTPSSVKVYGANAGQNVDFKAYLLRIKAEYGPVLAWYDHSVAVDKSAPVKQTYTNNFVWAQYQIKAYDTKEAKLVIQPTIRYLTTRDEVTPANNTNRLRSELWATVSF